MVPTKKSPRSHGGAYLDPDGTLSSVVCMGSLARVLLMGTERSASAGSITKERVRIGVTFFIVGNTRRNYKVLGEAILAKGAPKCAVARHGNDVVVNGK